MIVARVRMKKCFVLMSVAVSRLFRRPFVLPIKIWNLFRFSGGFRLVFLSPPTAVFGPRIALFWPPRSFLAWNIPIFRPKHLVFIMKIRNFGLKY